MRSRHLAVHCNGAISCFCRRILTATFPEEPQTRAEREVSRQGARRAVAEATDKPGAAEPQPNAVLLNFKESTLAWKRVRA